MSRPGIKPGSSALQASTLAKSYSNSLDICYSEPLHTVPYEMVPVDTGRGKSIVYKNMIVQDTE